MGGAPCDRAVRTGWEADRVLGEHELVATIRQLAGTTDLVGLTTVYAIVINAGGP